MANMRDDVAEVLLTKEQIAEKVQELGEILSREYEGKDPILVSVLKGAFVFKMCIRDSCRTGRAEDLCHPPGAGDQRPAAYQVGDQGCV